MNLKCDFKKAFALLCRALKNPPYFILLTFWLHFQSPLLKPEGVVQCWQQWPEDNEKCNTFFIFFVRIVCTPFTIELFRNCVENNNQAELFWNVDLHYFSLQTFIQMRRNIDSYCFILQTFMYVSNCLENTTLESGIDVDPWMNLFSL